ncbi:hypothetical protein DLJ53_09540 [Acuticoccus sediminis]|uniref:ABC transport system substrate-binding protein n=1 Tax=Acuticoccus sediminis TaxID=2184697 RepID=A0A8B2NTP5_9HYPH|nr:ABC transporter substrate-binding protein [Acuticoccus sediminis]RAI01648.1 hypothetical protein DLJ53_09540 [Acuticoccus sediminis]
MTAAGHCHPGGAAARGRPSRRDVLALLALLAAAPRAAAKDRPVVAMLGLASEEADSAFLERFRSGLAANGVVEGETIVLEHRHASGDMTLAGRQIAELVALGADVFVVPGPAAARLVKSMTGVPVVSGGLPLADPFLFESLGRPGGTVSGLSSFGEDLAAKRIEVIREALPDLRLLGVMHNVTDPVYSDWGEKSEEAARAAGLATMRLPLESGSPAEVDGLLGGFKASGGDVVLVIRDFLTHTNRLHICEAAARLGLPLVSEHPIFVEAGALMAYSEDVDAAMTHIASFVVRILDGTPAGEIPIELPTRFRLYLNLATADRLGIVFPPSLIARADSVLE